VANVYEKFPSQLSTIEGVTFYNLSTITELCDPKNMPSDQTLCISTIRVRPIIVDLNFDFFFNGHYSFSSSGKTENPTIGTTEDWIFINTVPDFTIAHPVHVHLINYQIVGMTQLKTFKSDFFGI
jgi:hypothetical protein